MLRLWKLALVVFAVACLVAPGAAVAQANHRPIEDFLNAQVAAPVWWYSMDYAPYRWARIDYTGFLNRMLMSRGHADLGTTFEGDVTEIGLPDGTARVHVRLFGRNVFVFGMMGYGGEDVMFGYPAVPSPVVPGPSVLGGAPPALAEVLMLVDFINPAGVGGALPDLRFFAADYDVLLNARVEGLIRAPFGVPEGTPGRLTFVSRSLSPHGQGVPGQDYWPAEIINVEVVGQ